MYLSLEPQLLKSFFQRQLTYDDDITVFPRLEDCFSPEASELKCIIGLKARGDLSVDQACGLLEDQITSGSVELPIESVYVIE